MFSPLVPKPFVHLILREVCITCNLSNGFLIPERVFSKVSCQNTELALCFFHSGFTESSYSNRFTYLSWSHLEMECRVSCSFWSSLFFGVPYVDILNSNLIKRKIFWRLIFICFLFLFITSIIAELIAGPLFKLSRKKNIPISLSKNL